MDKPSSQCGVPMWAGSQRPTSVYSTYLPSPMPYTELPLPLLSSVRGGPGPGGGCGAGLLLLHRSLDALMKSFCELHTCPLPQAGRGQANSRVFCNLAKEQVYQFNIQV